ncbi:hypothetical protein J4406_02495 [Candidatus Woesearchaeota archaeon]|nr:hypothetical protein [Candidatus Woesearchaeota archaeon]
MVFVREIKKGGKIYRYLYKSKRVNGKVKSIYIGREEVKDIHAHKESKAIKTHKISKKNHKKVSSEPKAVHHKVDDKWMVDRIIEFNRLMEESMSFVIQNKIEAAANHYNKLLNVYNQLSNHISDEEKLKLYDKTKQIYDRIQELNIE